MNTRVLLTLLVILLFTTNSSSQSSAFTYQGKLNDAGAPANGQYDLVFRIYEFDTGGSPLATEQVIENVQVSSGLFKVELSFDFPPFTTISAQWIEVGVRPGASTGSFMTLAPRQRITSSPYAMQSAFSVFSTNATNATNVTGVVPIANGGTGSSTKSYVDLTTDQTVGGVKTFTGTLNGNGSGLTNLNGANIVDNSISSGALAADTFPNNQNLARLGMKRWDLLGKRISVPANPFGSAFDGTHIWVACRGTSQVLRIRVSDGGITGLFAVGTDPEGVLFDGTYIWVVNNGSANVTRIRVFDGMNMGNIAVGNFPHQAAFDGTNVWVSIGSSANVTKIRASDGVVLGTVPTGLSPGGVAFDGVHIWVGGSALTKIRASDSAVVGSFAGVGNEALLFDGAHVWATTVNAVEQRRADTGAVLNTVTIDQPAYMAFDGTNVWVGSFAGGIVTKVKAETATIVGRYPTGSAPGGIVFDGANIWVSNFGSGTVSKIPVFK